MLGFKKGDKIRGIGVEGN